MNIDENYLSGKAINEGFNFSLKDAASIASVGRDVYLVEKVKGKRILHIGFCDHMHMIDEQRQKNMWLHDKLYKSAKICVGVDINNEAVNYVK